MSVGSNTTSVGLALCRPSFREGWRGLARGKKASSEKMPGVMRGLPLAERGALRARLLFDRRIGGRDGASALGLMMELREEDEWVKRLENLHVQLLPLRFKYWRVAEKWINHFQLGSFAWTGNGAQNGKALCQDPDQV
jgi:hypothetical protein